MKSRTVDEIKSPDEPLPTPTNPAEKFTDFKKLPEPLPYLLMNSKLFSNACKAWRTNSRRSY